MLIQKKESGFTLIEVLIAIVLLAVGLLGVSTLVVGIMRGNTHSDMVTTATILAQDEMEDIRRAKYAGTTSGNFPSNDYGTITDYPLFKRVVSIVTSSPAANMKTVTVTVYWDSDGKSVSLKTIMAKEG